MGRNLKIGQKEAHDEDQEMSTDTEAALTMSRLCMGDPRALVSLHAAVCEMLMLANAPQPEEQEYYYDSDDSVLELDVEFPDIAEWVVQWKVARKATAPMPSWRMPSFGKMEQACYKREPYLRDVLNHNRQVRMVANIPVQQATSQYSK